VGGQHLLAVSAALQSAKDCFKVTLHRPLLRSTPPREVHLLEVSKPGAEILPQNAIAFRKACTGGVDRYEKRRRLLVVGPLDDSVEASVAILVDFTALRVLRVTFSAEAKCFGC
jgi:hypothetical protein